jgi:hypothetical protein
LALSLAASLLHGDSIDQGIKFSCVNLGVELGGVLAAWLHPGGIDQGIKFSCVNLGVEFGGVKLGKAVSIAPVFKRLYSEMNTFSRAK